MWCLDGSAAIIEQVKYSHSWYAENQSANYPWHSANNSFRLLYSSSPLVSSGNTLLQMVFWCVRKCRTTLCANPFPIVCTVLLPTQRLYFCIPMYDMTRLWCLQTDPIIVGNNMGQFEEIEWFRWKLTFQLCGNRSLLQWNSDQLCRFKFDSSTDSVRMKFSVDQLPISW